MSKFGVKDDVSTGKNTLATGGGAVNSKKLHKSAVITVYLSGNDVDLIDWSDIIGPHEGDDYELNKMDMKFYIGQHDNKIT